MVVAKHQLPFIYESRKDELFDLADKFHGNLRLIADKANMTVTELRYLTEKFPDFKKACDEAKDNFYEIASNKLAELIEKGQFQALNLFFSKSPQAKARGWGERTEQEQNIHLNDTEKAAAAKRMLGIDQPSDV